MRRTGPKRGFTLLEVMVALAILASALMAVADLCGNALRNHEYARDLAEATLLARGKMAELEQKYEDEGFKDFDQAEDGDFADAGRSDVRWHLDLLRPNADLSADQLVSALAGTGGNAQDLVTMLMGGAGATAAGATTQSSSSTSASQPTLAGGGMAAGAIGKLIQSQVTLFGETLKQSFREMRLTVSWRDGKTPHGFTVTTHLVVLNPRAPGGTRGDNPEVPANLSVAGSPGAAGAAGLPGAGGAAVNTAAGVIGGVQGAIPGLGLPGAPVLDPGDASGTTRSRNRSRWGQ